MNDIVATLGFQKKTIEDFKEDNYKFISDNSVSVAGYMVLDIPML